LLALIVILKNRYDITPLVILPKKGKLEERLIKENIDYKVIRSFKWSISNEYSKAMRFVHYIIKNLVNQVAYIRICVFLRNKDVQLIHNNTVYAYLGAKYALNHGIPLVWHLREMVKDDHNCSFWNKNKTLEMLRRADALIAISDCVYEKYSKEIDGRNIYKVLNGVDKQKYYNPQKAIFRNSTAIMCIVGYINMGKGQLELAKAIKQIVDNGITDFRLYMVGIESDSSTRRFIYESGLEEYVDFTGYQENTRQYYELADIVFVCSKAEAFGRVTAEAMMSGCLVIGADTGATKELVNHMNTGLLYEKGNEKDLAEKILFALTHRERMGKLARNGREYAIRHLTADENACHIAEIYKTL